MKENISDEEIITLVVSRLRERTQKINEYEIVFKKLEEMNKKLIKSEANKSRFLSLIRNEFNNPLFAVIPLIKKIIDKKTLDLNILDNVYIEILKLNFQLNNLMAAAEIENDILEKNLNIFDLSSLIMDIKGIMEHIYSEKKIELIINLSDNFKEFYFDREKINIILSNLLDNAYNYSKEETEIFLDISLEDEKIILILKNIGKKINFINPFESFNDENSHLKEIKGLGLGLNIVKTFSEFLLGKMEIDQEENSINIVKLEFTEFKDDGDDLFGHGLDDFDFGDDEEDDFKEL